MSLPGDKTFPSEHEAMNEEVKNETFHQAAAAGDLAKVSQFLDRGANVNSRDEDRQTALFLAVCNDSAKMVRLLLSRGADASLRDGWEPENPDGFTAIECAALFNAEASMQELLAHGIDFESSDAVLFAARKAHTELLKQLLGVTKNFMSDHIRQETLAVALREMAAHQSLEMVRWILDLQGKERALDADWQRALNEALLHVLYGLNALDYNTQSQAIDQAIQILDVLIDSGASVNAQTDVTYQSTALSYTLKMYPSLKLTAHMLDRGADPNFCGPHGRSPFFEVLSHLQANGDLINVFTNAGAVLGPPDSLGQTPLHHVQTTSAASWLLASGADISVVDKKGETPLHKASSASREDLVAFFLEANSPVDHQNNSGWTPLMQARSVSISRALLERGANIHATSEQGVTVLHHAVDESQVELVSLLLANGADIHARAQQVRRSYDSDSVVMQNTPLHVAVSSPAGTISGGTLEMIGMLIDHGADIEAREGTGKTPLLLAVAIDHFTSSARALNVQVVNFLLERGADARAVDDNGKNAAQLADERHYMFDETGKFEQRPITPDRVLSFGPRGGRVRGRGRGRGTACR